MNIHTGFDPHSSRYAMWIGATSPQERIAHEAASRTASLARLDAERDAYWARQPAAISPLASPFAMLSSSTSSAPSSSTLDAAINTARLQRLLDTVLRAHPDRAADIERFLHDINSTPMES